MTRKYKIKKGINILIDTDDKEIIIRKEHYNYLTNLKEDDLFKLAKQFDDGFYTNDGYHVEISKKEFSYSYDDGCGEIDIITL